MIRTALEFIRSELEAYMVEREQDAAYTIGSVVSLQSLLLPDGTINTNDTTHVTTMVVNIEEICREGKRPYYTPANNKEFYKLNPPVELDISILFAAHSNDYPTALRDISDVVAFFQANPVFDEQRFPSLNKSVTEPTNKPWQVIDKLVFTLHNLSFEQQNNLWGLLGSKYIPSVVYKMKMLTVFETRSSEKTPGVTEINFNEN